MLVLTRREHDAIQIGPDIEVKVLEITGTQVKLGITAPLHVPVHRQEIWVRIQEEGAGDADGE